MEIKYKKISIIIPCLNEQAFVEQVIKDIINQDFPIHQMEVFFIDGGSKDKTRSIIKKYQKKYAQIFLLDNKDKFIPQALNLGIRQSTGEVIVRMDAHSSYPPNYVMGLLEWLQKSSAENIGGSWHIRPGDEGLIDEAIAHILGHPFGTAYASFKKGFLDYEEEVDTVPYGCFHRSIFEKYGYFNEHLPRYQDNEFNARIIKGGGTVLLVPDVFCIYYAQSSFTRLWKNNYGNGKWAMLMPWLSEHKNYLSLGNYVPFLFLVYLFGAIALSCFIPFTPYSIFLFFPAIIYIFLIGRASLSIALNTQRLELLPAVGIAFMILHASYGFGSFSGLLRRWFRKNPTEA